MDRQLTSESYRDYGHAKVRLLRQAFPALSAHPVSHSSKNFPPITKHSRTMYPRHLGGASTPDLRERAFGALDEEQIPPVPPIPSRIPPPKLPASPSLSNLSRRYKGAVASPSTPSFQHYQPQAEKQLPPSPARSTSNLHHLNTTTTSPSTPNFGEGAPRQSKLKKLRSGVKKLLHRDPKPSKKEPSRPLEISSPTDFRQLELDQNLKPVGIIATDYVPGNLSVPRFALPQLEALELDSGSEYSEPSEHVQDNLTPAQRSARALGLELENSVPLPDEERVVREYEDVDPSYDASEDTYITNNDNYMPKLVPEHVGEWTCCTCSTSHPLLFTHPSSSLHPIGILHCTCPHTPCEECALSGGVTAFKPPCEPVSVPLDTSTFYGIVCSGCGVSWPARSIKPKSSSTSGFVERLLVKVLCDSSSTHHHHTHSVRQEMEREYGEQVEEVLLKFSGRMCTCEEVLDATGALCWKVKVKVEKKNKGFGATGRDREMGIGKDVLTVKGKGEGKVVRHENPLMSNPV